IFTTTSRLLMSNPALTTRMPRLVRSLLTSIRTPERDGSIRCLVNIARGRNVRDAPGRMDLAGREMHRKTDRGTDLTTGANHATPARDHHDARPRGPHRLHRLLGQSGDRQASAQPDLRVAGS